jgi:hypothetical protein
MIPWGALARVLIRIGGAILLNRVISYLHDLGHHPPADIDITAAGAAGLPDLDPPYPEDEQEVTLRDLECPGWGDPYWD